MKSEHGEHGFESKSCQDLSFSLHGKKTLWPRIVKRRKYGETVIKSLFIHWQVGRENSLFILNSVKIGLCFSYVRFNCCCFFQHSVTSFKSQKVTENQEIEFGCGFDDDELSGFSYYFFTNHDGFDNAKHLFHPHPLIWREWI